MLKSSLIRIGAAAATSICLLGISTGANAMPITIDFSAAPGGAFVSYVESGVTFTAVSGGLTSDNFGPTPNGTRGLIGDSSPFAELRADIAGGADMVSIDLGDQGIDSDLIFLEAFNAANMSIGFTSLDIGTFAGMTTLSLSVANIDHVIFGSRAPAVNGSSVYSDNFTFNATSTPVPEPGTLALFGLGLLGLGIARRRKAA